MIETPLQPLDQSGKVKLRNELQASGPSGSDSPRLLAILWLSLCLDARIHPDEAKQGRPSHASVARSWAGAAAKILNHCSHAIGARAATVASIASALHRQALDHRAAAASTPSLF